MITDHIRKELIAEFQATCKERLDRVASAWVALENESQAAPAHGALILRELHTLKGEAKLMGFGTMSQIVHHVEDLVVLVERSGFKQSSDVGDLVLRTVDVLAAMVFAEATDTTDEPTKTLSRALVDAASILSSDTPAIRRSPRRIPIVELHEENTVVESSPNASAITAGGVPSGRATRNTIDTGDTDPNADANSRTGLARASSAHDVPLDANPRTGLARASSAHDVPILPTLDAPRGSPEPLERDTFVRIDASTAQRLADAAGEAVVAHARYRSAAIQLRLAVDEVAPRQPALHLRLAAMLDQIDEDIHEGTLVTRALEMDARTLRLVPLAPLFRMHLRAVRELARELGKRASLQISDGAVAVDREVVERLGAPLLHLLRNCVDHGLESPEVRRAAGKLEIGRITIAAERTGADVVVIVEDDGAGVDSDLVRRRAIAAGILDPSASFDEADAHGILFSPGFSTRTTATETSGRGVGLDVVKRQVEGLGGIVRMSSRRGKGTRFELRVPISVALARALIVEENGQLFAIPHGAVEAVIAIEPQSIETIHTRRHVPYRGMRIPIVELAAALQLPATSIAPADLRALVIAHEGQRVAILVDAWRGDAEVVVKPLDAIAATPAAIGACTLDGGALALVLSPGELVTRALGEVPRIRLAATAPRAAVERRVLLVEDSAITRTMIAQLLRMLDYQVAEAEDGLRALRTLEEVAVDAIVTDIEMPELDGIGLIKRLRADRRWQDVPVIVLSTRGTADDKQRAVAAGADAYLVKTEFSETALRDVLARHVRRG